MASELTATERFLARLGTDRERFVRDHFDAAWGWYDRLTALCTGGLVHLWREHCVEACALGPEDRVLDVATGTGGLLLRARRRLGPGGFAVGLDLSAKGLSRARTAIGDGVPTGWIQAEALSLPFHDGTFDTVMVGFAFRHLGAPGQALRELRRVLAPGGRLAVLDFLQPRPGLLGRVWLAYLFWVVPVVSGLLSRRPALYRLARYLPHTILDALGPDELREEMRRAGLALERKASLCVGIVWLFVGRRLGVSGTED